MGSGKIIWNFHICFRHSNKRRVEIFWPNNTALIDSEISYKIQQYANFETGSGIILIEVPIKTRHIAKLNYDYTQKPQNTKGSANVVYNNNKILDGKYNSDSVASAGLEKEITTIELENKWKPLGINYEKTFAYSAPGDSTNLPTKVSLILQFINVFLIKIMFFRTSVKFKCSISKMTPSFESQET